VAGSISLGCADAGEPMLDGDSRAQLRPTSSCRVQPTELNDQALDRVHNDRGPLRLRALRFELASAAMLNGEVGLSAGSCDRGLAVRAGDLPAANVDAEIALGEQSLVGRRQGRELMLVPAPCSAATAGLER
jgi:hypothetical protein